MPASIGIDWGTSSLRAMLFDGDGNLAETRVRPFGIRHLPEGGFDAALADICAGWPACAVIAAGMVGSRQGWREVRYLDVPVDTAALVHGLVTIHAHDGRGVSIVPGVRDAAKPDVMRGEETQILGALEQFPILADEARLVLPGTHSKWVDVRGGRIVHFATVMTGELFAVLREHSILGAGVPAGPGQSHPEAFEAGVRAARASGSAGALTRLFSARALVLESRLESAAVPDYLSGLLIGEEWRAMLASGWLHHDRIPVLIGAADLCDRYVRAAQLFDLEPPQVIADAAVPGLWHIIRAMHAQDVATVAGEQAMDHAK